MHGSAVCSTNISLIHAYRWNSKRHTLLITEPHCRSTQVWHVLSNNFTALPATHAFMYRKIICRCLPSRSWYSFTEPGEMEGWVGLDTTSVSKHSAQDCSVTGIAAVSCSSRHASLGCWNAEAKIRTHDLLGREPWPYHSVTESPKVSCHQGLTSVLSPWLPHWHFQSHI